MMEHKPNLWNAHVLVAHGMPLWWSGCCTICSLCRLVQKVFLGQSHCESRAPFSVRQMYGSVPFNNKKSTAHDINSIFMASFQRLPHGASCLQASLPSTASSGAKSCWLTCTLAIRCYLYTLYVYVGTTHSSLVLRYHLFTEASIK